MGDSVYVIISIGFQAARRYPPSGRIPPYYRLVGSAQPLVFWGGTNCTEIRSGKDGVKKGAGSLKDISRKNESAKDVVAIGSVKDSEGRSSGTALVSDDSMATAGSAHSSARSSPTRRQRKRVLTISSDELGSSSGSDGAASTGKGGVMPQSKRGRGRLPTTGLTVDKQTCLKTQRSEIKATGSMSSMREVRSAKATEGSSKKDPECRLKESAAMALKVCSKPGNLKSTYQRALKELAVTIMEVTEELANRPAAQETERLRAVNAGQQEEILQLRQELQEVRKELARISRALTLSNPVETPAPASSNTTEDQEELRVQRIMRAVGTMVDARFASLEMRLPPEPRIRPPLAADRRKTCEKSPDPPLIVDATLESTSVQAALPPSANKKTQGPRRKTTVLAPLSELGAFPPAPVVLTESWSTVTRRGAKSRGKVVKTAAAVPPEEKAPSSKKRTKKRLRAPRSQAVVLKLQPEAASRGLTYRSVLAEARAKIDLESLGIPVQRIRSSLTGAKVLVVDGDDQVEKADLLANRLKEILPAEGVEISRPSVTAAMRISGLDDSVSREEITDELAKIGGCPSESIKVGEIKSGPGGMGQVLVRCPVSTAAKIAAVPKLRIGWSVLRAHLLEARRLQCFRCHELGHVSARCPSSVDRSRDCYRCGQAGHVASGCSLAPHCTVCVSAGRPADHVSGGKACAKPRDRDNDGRISPRLRARGVGPGNLNHSARAQDLLFQSMVEGLTHLAVVAEPYRVLTGPDWAADLDGRVAIIRRGCVGAPPEFAVVERGRSFVAVLWAEMIVVGVYFSPNRTLAEFEGLLLELSRVTGRSHSRQLLVLGDLNAKSSAWGSSRTCPRGRAVEEWLVESGLVILNRGTEFTCVRRLGGSVVDVTFASPDVACRIRGWAVMVGEETLSDHRYIRFSIVVTPGAVSTSSFFGGGAEGPRWAQKRLDVERLHEAAVVQAWRLDSLGEPMDVRVGAERMREAMSRVCDAAMPRIRALAPKRRVHWWTEEIANLRQSCNVSRRAYQRSRRRRTHRDPEEQDRLYVVYRTAVRALCVAIGMAKEAAWNDLLASLDRDPWGRPYRLARNALRPWAPPTTSTLPPETLHRVVGGLFPDSSGTAFVPPVMATVQVADGGELEGVSQAEFKAVVAKMRSKRTAPGPDGLSSKAWALALTEDGLGPALRRLFSKCLREGRFPEPWRTGRLVLIPKDGRPRDEPSGYRPIVVLDEAGKLLERIVAGRLVQHLENIGPNLASNQFGFRRGRSTVDAVLRVRDLTDQACSGGACYWLCQSI
uniref:CCHC-type domain-containing protein n=1 Tax=Bombyx mori TaxID=7091 RepID=A0A8R2QW71_BOMMO|nr:uncharacterized protein LOC119629086 [Bombyx mori]